MTNQEAFNSYNFLNGVESAFYSLTPGKIEIPKSIMPYVSGNLRLVKPFFTEKQAIEADFRKIWEKDYKFDGEKYEKEAAYKELSDADYLAFRNSKPNIKKVEEWLFTKNNIELVKVDSLEGVAMRLADLEMFEKIMLK